MCPEPNICKYIKYRSSSDTDVFNIYIMYECNSPIKMKAEKITRALIMVNKSIR